MYMPQKVYTLIMGAIAVAAMAVATGPKLEPSNSNTPQTIDVYILHLSCMSCISEHVNPFQYVNNNNSQSALGSEMVLPTKKDLSLLTQVHTFMCT